MSIEREAKQHIHELVEQLGPNQIAAVQQLLEVMLEPDAEMLSDEDVQAVAHSREYFREHPNPGVSFEEFAAECGYTMEQILDHKD